MTFTPIARTLPQYVDLNGDPYSGAVLKAYKENTSTPINFATDNTGSVLVGTIALNAAGYTEVSGNEVIPHLEENFKLALFPDQAAADSNTGELWIIDNIIFSDFAGGELTNVSDGTARTSGINVGQVQDGAFTCLGITAGAADAYELTPSVAITAYVSTQEFTAQIHATNLTTTPYLQISGIAAITSAVIKKLDESKAEIALAVGDLKINGIYKFKRNAANDSWISLGHSLEIATQIEVNAGNNDTNIVTSLKLATKGFLLKSVQTFTASGTWNKPTDIRAVMVEVVSGGGGGGNIAETGSGNDGGDSSFGSHVSANGGSGANAEVNIIGGGSGGNGVNGDINVTGNGGGSASTSKVLSHGGGSFFGGGAPSNNSANSLNRVGINGINGGGGGGGNSSSGSSGSGGGGGGYAKKFITSGLGTTETIIIGIGGTGTGTAATMGGTGGDGLIVVTEYI